MGKLSRGKNQRRQTPVVVTIEGVEGQVMITHRQAKLYRRAVERRLYEAEHAEQRHADMGDYLNMCHGWHRATIKLKEQPAEDWSVEGSMSCEVAGKTIELGHVTEGTLTYTLKP